MRNALIHSDDKYAAYKKANNAERIKSNEREERKKSKKKYKQIRREVAAM